MKIFLLIVLFSSTNRLLGQNFSDDILNIRDVNKSETFSKTTDTSKKQDIFLQAVNYYNICLCDSLPSTCDMNCCCDEDCTSENRVEFLYCEHTISVLDDRYCNYWYHILNNSDVQEVIVTNRNPLCISFDNFAERNFYRDVEPVKTLEEMKELAKKESNFLLNVHQVSDQKLLTTNFIYQVKQNYTGLLYFELPYSQEQGKCTSFQPVIFRKDEERTCSHVISDVKESCQENIFLNPLFYCNDFSLSTNNNNSQNLTRLPPFICNNISEEYNEMKNISTYKNGSCSVVKNVEYEVLHNSENTIEKVNVYLKIIQLSKSEEYKHKLRTFTQHFSVKFKLNKDVPIFHRSGNPGYLFGYNVLAGTLNNNSTKVTLNGDKEGWLTMPFPSSSGECGDNRMPIVFGEDVISSCNINFNCENFSGNLCSFLNSLILSMYIKTFPTHIGIFGDSDPRRVEDWVIILNQNEPNTKSTSCNLIQGVHLNIFHSKLGSYEIPQMKILAAIIKYDFSYETKVLHKGSSCQKDLQVHTVKFSVSFIDISEEPKLSFALPPTFDIRLPYDFFYPFSSSGFTCLNYFNTWKLNFIFIFVYSLYYLKE